MAKCTAEIAVRTVMKKSGVTLELTERETIALAIVLGHIGGSPESTARAETNQIADALHAAGYDFLTARDQIGYDPAGEPGQEGRTLTMRRPIPAGVA